MNSWTFFGALFDSFDAQFLAAVQAMIASLVAYVRAPLLTGCTVYIAGMAAIELYHPDGNPLFFLIRKVIRVGFVLALVGTASYTAIFGVFFLTTLPNEITAAITGAGAGGNLTPAAFDKMLGGGWVALVQIWDNLPGWSAKSIVIGLTAAIMFVIGAFFIAIGFLVWIASHIMLGLSIAVGPLFAAMLLWEKTVKYFDGWLTTILALIITQVLIVGLLALLLTTEANILTQITTLNAKTGANANDVAGQIHYLVEAALLFFMIGYLSPKLPELAQSLTGGAAAGVSALSHMAHGALGSGARAVGSAAAKGAQAAGRGLGSGAAGMRSITPAGRAPG